MYHTGHEHTVGARCEDLWELGVHGGCRCVGAASSDGGVQQTANDAVCRVHTRAHRGPRWQCTLRGAGRGCIPAWLASAAVERITVVTQVVLPDTAALPMTTMHLRPVSACMLTSMMLTSMMLTRATWP